jgi:D-tyrosyl-tRNA(Tyr) deacylase
MRVLVQRSKKSSVKVDNKVVGQILKGMVLFVGFTAGDSEENIDYMIQKILKLRIFDDDNNVMNRNILETNGEVLSISQFTLYADTKKGNRPSYIKALNSKEASILYQKFNEKLSKYIKVETGIFQSEMEVSITNDGPITIMLER